MDEVSWSLIPFVIEYFGRQETQRYNQAWWLDHNNQFKQGREQFIKKILEAEYPDQPDKNTLSADEMSIFYRYYTKHYAGLIHLQGFHELPVEEPPGVQQGVAEEELDHYFVVSQTKTRGAFQVQKLDWPLAEG